MRHLAVAIALATAAGAGAACDAFEATPETPVVTAGSPDAALAPDGGLAGDAATEAGSGPAATVVCPGRAPCGGAEGTCCVSTIGGAVTTCTKPDACFFDGTNAFHCDDTGDCQAGFACCAQLDPNRKILAGSMCMKDGCGSADALVELCRPELAASCGSGKCTANTTLEPKAYAYCVK